MINFDNIEIKLSEEIKYSFVGIQKQQETLFFYVPKGLKQYWELYDSWESKKNLFFLLYKTLNKFAAICEERGYIHQNKIDNRDGVVKLEDGSGENLATDKLTILYKKLNFLDSLLDLYDELKILSLVYRLGSTEKIKYEQIYYNLHRANFLYNGAIYIDTMNLPRLEAHFEQTDIICLYCYLLTEIKYQLQEQVSNEIESLAQRYQDKYLHSDSNLFNRDTYQITLELIIDSFENIDSKTVYKDDDYWDFYEAIERFLYSDFNKYEDGEIWGINNFCYVWESACLSYLLNNNLLENILLFDDTYLKLEKKISYESAAKIILLDKNLFQIKRNQISLRPDIVLINEDKTTGIQSHSHILYRDKWNHGYSWYTQFEYIIPKSRTIIEIAFKGQKHGEETIDELEKYFDTSAEIPSDIRYVNKHIYKSISINNSLPNKFFSYWKLPEKLTRNDFLLMKKLNHVYYYALFNQSIKTSNEFIEKFNWKEEKIIQEKGNIFGYFEASEWYLSENKFHPYDAFVRNLLNTEIIDFKYISANQIRDKENIEEIKSKSIRKQFVYEYLLEEYLEKQKQIKQPKISSSFWIPEYNSGKEVIVAGDEYLDGYIDLALVDPIKLLQHYVQS